MWREKKGGSVCKPFCFLQLLQASQSHTDLDSGPRNFRRLWAPDLLMPSELAKAKQLFRVPPYPLDTGHILLSLAGVPIRSHVYRAQTGCLPVCRLYTQTFVSTVSFLAPMAGSKGTHSCPRFMVEEIKD